MTVTSFFTGITLAAIAVIALVAAVVVVFLFTGCVMAFFDFLKSERAKEKEKGKKEEK